MAVVNPRPKEQAAAEVHPIYDALTGKFGHMPNFFAVMAHRPGVLKQFVPLYGAVMGEGPLDQRYKELAYLKTSLSNACEY